MALPLEPDIDAGMFPDTLVEPFIVAPEVARLAGQVIASFDEFEPIQTAIREAGLRIVYAFETKPFDPEKEEFKPHTIAKVTKASPLWRSLTDFDLVIQFRRTFWDLFKFQQRRAVLHHELMHIVVEGDEGKLKVSLAPHQVEDFALTMRRFGPILPGRALFAKAIIDWQHEQDHGEPTPLRPVEAIVDAIASLPIDDQVAVHDAVDHLQGLRDLADQTGTDITISAGDRSATIKGGRTRESHGYQVADRGCPDGDCALADGHAGEHLPTAR